MRSKAPDAVRIGLETGPTSTWATGTWSYYAVSGSGAVLHSLNPRLHPDQVVWIADNAEDQIIFFDLTFLPLIEIIAQRLTTMFKDYKLPGVDAA